MPSLFSFSFSFSFVFFGFFVHWNLIASSAAVGIIRVGALLDVDSALGKSCLDALQLAVNNVNSNPLLLNGFKLQLLPANSYCDAIAGASSGNKNQTKMLFFFIWGSGSIQTFILFYFLFVS